MMAGLAGRTHSKIDLNQNEISRISKALKDEQFVKLLSEYAQELNEPENRRRYEEEITALEAERGCAVTFIKPNPGYVIKTRQLSDGSKVFINVCSDSHVGKPVSKPATVGHSQGLSWSIPYSQSQPRQDIDRGGEQCSVYDVIFHPDTLYLADRDPRINTLVHTTALDAVEKAFQVMCDRNQLKFPKMKFKGVFRPTVLRTPLSTEEEGGRPPLPAGPPTLAEVAPHLPQPYTTPEHWVKQRSDSSLQEHLIQGVVSCRPKELEVQVHLPLLESAAGVDLDVQGRCLTLVREEQPRYKLHLELPFPVDEEAGSAKFDKSRKTLVVTLPVPPAASLTTPAGDQLVPGDEKVAPLQKAERLSSSDSGIEEDPGYRIPHSDGGAEEGSLEGAEKEEDSESFLEKSVPYCLASHSVSVRTDVITVTLDVKNVSPESFQKKLHPDRRAVSVKFCSVGSGHLQLQHAFAIDFLIARPLEEEHLEVEFWDNNVILNVTRVEEVRSYKTGLCLTALKEQEVSLEQSTGHEGKRKRSTIKYKQERHPRCLPQEEAELLQGATIERKERHNSCDSIDSCISESPLDTIVLKLKEEDEEEEEKTEESCDEDILLQPAPPRYLRANSEESTHTQPRGILKRRMSGLAVAGSRFRCYSESHLDDVRLCSSGEQLSSGLSQSTIAEEEAVQFGLKKSVRFNDKVQKQLYRINSSILANTSKNKRKADKKKRALQRRMSEGDAASLETAASETASNNKMASSSSLDLSAVVRDGWGREEDSGLASSLEENLVLTEPRTTEAAKPKTKKMTKKRSKHFVMSNELIFDLDI